MRKTCGLIIIGDEVLRGHVADRNSTHLLPILWDHGIRTEKICVVPDRFEEIEKAVREFSERYDFVITSGGIGPTHDDVTMAAVARAFSEDLVQNETMRAILCRLSSGPIGQSETRLNNLRKLSYLPFSCQLVFSGEGPSAGEFPLFNVKNVYMFPGVPEHFRTCVDVFVRKVLIPLRQERFFCRELFLTVDEADISHIVDDIATTHSDRVRVGSYPCADSTEPYRLRIYLESNSQGWLEDASHELSRRMDPAWTCGLRDGNPSSRITRRPVGVSLVPGHADVLQQLSQSSISPLAGCLKEAWAVMREALQQYSPEQIGVCFNGGKDGTVVLHLYCVMVRDLFGPGPTIKAIYLRDRDPFSDADAFVRSFACRLGVDVVTIENDVKSGLAVLERDCPEIRACVMGCRRMDPYCLTLKHFSMTDPHWPAYMRILPILDWSYTDVWAYLLFFKVPYCSLYDQGYSSIGLIRNTQKNPLLKVPGTENEYYPAHTLMDPAAERVGRVV